MLLQESNETLRRQELTKVNCFFFLTVLTIYNFNTINDALSTIILLHQQHKYIQSNLK